MSGDETFHEDHGDGYDDDNPYLPRTPEDYRAAWAELERLWAETLAKALTLDEAQLHESVDGDWHHRGFAERDLDVLISRGTR